jgi:hypothetical protein
MVEDEMGTEMKDNLRRAAIHLSAAHTLLLTVPALDDADRRELDRIIGVIESQEMADRVSEWPE